MVTPNPLPQITQTIAKYQSQTDFWVIFFFWTEIFLKNVFIIIAFLCFYNYCQYGLICFKLFKLTTKKCFDKSKKLKQNKKKSFETLKDTSFSLPIWYQDGLTNQWKSKKLILQRKDMLLFLQMDPISSHDFLFRRFNLRGPPEFRLDMKQQKTQKERIPI